LAEERDRIFGSAARLFGWAALLLGLPIAVLGAYLPPNEYAVTLDIDALDCDGPSKVYIFALPAFALYSAALVIHGRRWRRPAYLIIALVCFAICVAVAANIARAVAVDQRQAAACALK
jgi:hypothetical protein